MINNVNYVPQKFIYPASEGPIQKGVLGDVLVNCIGRALSLREFAVLARVCKTWQTIIQPNIDEKLLKEVSFGKDKWLSVPGVFSVSEEIAFTENQKKELITKLKDRCNFFNESNRKYQHRFQNGKMKRTWQTQKLIFFPEKINGEPRTVNSQNKLFHIIKEVLHDGTAFECIVGKEDDAFRNQPAPKSYWGLVTLDVVPGSRGVTYAKKESLLKSKGYEVLTHNDATTSILIMNLGPSREKKDYFFDRARSYWTYTATTELYDGNRLGVGAAASSGIRLTSFPKEEFHVNLGAAGVAEI